MKLASTATVSLLLILLANPGGTIAAESSDKSAKEHFGAFAVRVLPIECNGGCSMTCRSVCQPGDGCSPPCVVGTVLQVAGRRRTLSSDWQSAVDFIAAAGCCGSPAAGPTKSDARAIAAELSSFPDWGKANVSSSVNQSEAPVGEGLGLDCARGRPAHRGLAAVPGAGSAALNSSAD
jgi:hypothetical protein